MIIRTKRRAHVVIGEMLWLNGCYLATGGDGGSTGAILDLKAIDATIAELKRVRELVADRGNASPAKHSA